MEDLSAVLKSYEKMGFPVEKILVEQYLQEEKTAAEFFSYYQIYRKYGTGLPESDRVLDGSLSVCGTGDDHPDGTGGNTTGAQYGTGVSAGCAGSEHRTVFRESQIQKVLTEVADSSVFSGRMMQKRHSETGLRAEKKVCRSAQNGN